MFRGSTRRSLPTLHYHMHPPEKVKVWKHRYFVTMAITSLNLPPAAHSYLGSHDNDTRKTKHTGPVRPGIAITGIWHPSTPHRTFVLTQPCFYESRFCRRSQEQVMAAGPSGMERRASASPWPRIRCQRAHEVVCRRSSPSATYSASLLTDRPQVLGPN